MSIKKTVFKRKIYDAFLQWKRESDGNTALLIEGSRRVGKTTVVKEFIANEYESSIFIDFTNAPSEVNDLFKDISNLNYLFLRLQFIYHVNLVERKSVIVFDEVQTQPLARQAIKHLVADHRYDYIETGSLISIKKNVKDILIPSEEEIIHMNPMDYEEFCWALGDKTTMPLLREAYDKKMPLGDAVNRRLMREFRLYMLVGGMPQAVLTYIETNNLEKVDKTKRSILNLYENDFAKIDSSGKMAQLFNAIPGELTKNASRYQISGVIKGGRDDRLYDEIANLVSSGTVNIAYHADNPSAGLSLHEDIHRYKLFVCDTGLFITLAFWDRNFTENIIYEKLLNDKLSADLGYVYENMVAQMLVSSGNRLFYYTFPKEKSNENYEIDFLLARRDKVCPIEVKSSGYKTHTSLDRFKDKFSRNILDRYLIYTKDLRAVEDIICVPIYMTPLL